MPRIERLEGIFFLTLSVRLHKLNVTPKLIYLKAHIWYEGIYHQYASAGTEVKVICKGQGQI